MSSRLHVSSKLIYKSFSIFNKYLYSCKYLRVIFIRQIVVAKQKNISIKWMLISSGLKENYYFVNVVWESESFVYFFFFNELISCIVQPSQTSHEYSKTGKIYDKNIWFSAVRLKVNLSFRIIPKTLDALEIILSIWLCHCPLLRSVRPKCLCSLTNFIGVPSKVILGRAVDSKTDTNQNGVQIIKNLSRIWV